MASAAGGTVPRSGPGASGRSWTHRLLIPASPSRDCSIVAAWIADAVGRREKVLYKHAPTENAAAVLGMSLPAAGVDPVVLSSGQVELADTIALRTDTQVHQFAGT